MTDSARPWTVSLGDCRDALAAMPEESVDACVTDTPYGLSTLLDPPNLDREALWLKLTEGAKEAPIRTLMRSWLDTGENPVMRGRGFMGNEWDALVPPPNTWRAVWRVLKPGAYCLAFGGTRTFDLITLSLRLADFEIEDSISGEGIGEPILRWTHGQGFPKRVRLDLKIDEHFGRKGDRPVLGRHPHPGSTGARKAMGDGWQDAPNLTGAATPEAARHVGYDRALRPGWEPIIVGVKPLRGTVAANALRYGAGGLHVDACRIPRGDVADIVAPRSDPANRTRGHVAAPMSGDAKSYADEQAASTERLKALGGYPANVILSEDAAAEMDRQSGWLHGADNIKPGVTKKIGKTACGYAEGMSRANPQPLDRGGGGASRFFYTAKASTSERDKGLEDLPPLTPGERCDREDDTAGITGHAGTRGEGGKNIGPCLKPISLMRWLVRLASPPGAHDPDHEKRPVILDPFAGTGSTGVACMVEGVRFVGCELMPEYAQIARMRLQHAYSLPPEDEPTGLPTRVGGQAKLF